MDSLDYKILCCLKENSRANATTISAKINLSTSAVIERIKKLEITGIIQQYTTILNQTLTGKELTAFISVRLEHPKYNEHFCQTIHNHNEISECHYIAGDFDFILKIVTKSGKTLEDILNHIKGIKGVSLTRTSVVLSTSKHEVCLLPEI